MSQRAALHTNVAPSLSFLQLVVKVFNRPFSRDGGEEATMSEEARIMTKLEELGVPFEGTLVASTTEWPGRNGKMHPAIIMKRAGR